MNMIGKNNVQMSGDIFEINKTNKKGIEVRMGNHSHIFESFSDISLVIKEYDKEKRFGHITNLINQYETPSDFNSVKCDQLHPKTNEHYYYINKCINVVSCITTYLYEKISKRKTIIAEELTKLCNDILTIEEKFNNMNQESESDENMDNKTLFCYYAVLGLLILTMRDKLQEVKKEFTMTSDYHGNTNLTVYDHCFMNIYRIYIRQDR